MAKATTLMVTVAVIVGARPGLGTRNILHPEKMRGDKTVPTDVG